MQITIYDEFSKRKNSTKQPDTGGVVFECKLKENVSVDSPIFILNRINPYAVYAKWDDRYYYIEDVVIISNDIAEYHCRLDALATFKSFILNTTAFVLYHSHTNTELSDSRLSTNTTKVIQSNTGVFTDLGSGKCAVVSVTGKGSCCSYAMTESDAKDLMVDFDDWYDSVTGRYDDNYLDNAADAADTAVDELHGLQKIGFLIGALGAVVRRGVFQLIATGNANQAIKSAIIIPFAKNKASTNADENVNLGQFESPHTGKPITNRVILDQTYVAIPWQANDWRRNAPYHELYLYIPHIGVIQLSPSDLIDEVGLNIYVRCDVTSGDAIFTVRGSSLANHVIGQYNTNLAGQFPIGSSNVTPMGAVTNTLAAVGGVALSVATSGASTASEAVVAASIGVNSMNSAMGICNSIIGTPSSIGSNAGGASIGLDTSVVCMSIFHDTNVAPSSVSAVMGTPTNEVMSLSGISGYVRTAGASVGGLMNDSERSEVNALLDSGIYIE